MSLTTTTGIEGVAHATSSMHRSSSPGPRSDAKSTASGRDIELRNLNDSLASDTTPQLRKARGKAVIQFATLCLTLFLAGWNDGTNGPLLPTFQRTYDVGFAVVSLVFISNCIGFVAGAIFNVFFSDKLGFGKMIVLGASLQVVAYSIQAPAPPYPLFVIAFAINGFGIGVQDAQANGYVASYEDGADTKMGIMHAVYGAGALAAPLVATQFSTMSHWSFHYLCSLGIAITTTVSLILVFRFKTQEACLMEIGQLPKEVETAEQSSNKYKQILKIRNVHLLAIFILIYVGVEVTIGGWIVTFIINVRNGGPSSGYISSGFFGGLTVGRVALLWVNTKIGEKRVIFLYTTLAIALELVVWLVPSLIGDAVAVSLVGVLLGPIYPIVMNVSGRILPHWLLTGAIGWIAGLGQAGSAAIPFLTGALASSSGIWTLHPLLVSMMTTMLILWALVPGNPRRVD